MTSARFLSAWLIAGVLPITACTEQELPTRPEDDPRFTAVAIDAESARPRLTQSVSAGTLSYDVEARYQLGSGYDDEPMWIEIYVYAVTDGVTNILAYDDVLLDDDDTGLESFEGSVIVPQCDSLGVTVILETDADRLSTVASDGYQLNITGTALPC